MGKALYDQSFSYSAVRSVLRKSDFSTRKYLRNPTEKDKAIREAIQAASSNFGNANPLTFILSGGKKINRIAEFNDLLVVRKINQNLRFHAKTSFPSRAIITSNVRSILSEGVPYKVYRLDIKAFFESFTDKQISSCLNKIPLLGTRTVELIHHILTQNGTGLPRGLSISSTISEMLMVDFDHKIRSLPCVFYYARFVDDILIVTSATESEKDFLALIEELLYPHTLNPRKLEKPPALASVKPIDKSKTTATQINLLTIEYLGYNFSVFDPWIDKGIKNSNHFRDVRVDIAEAKVKKIKTRIVASVRSYCSNLNFDLLVSRLKFLTCNFSVIDKNRDQKRLAGIYYNYHMVTPSDSDALVELDKFLRAAVLSARGPVFSDFFSKTTKSQRRQLLRISFSKNFHKEAFVYTSPKILNKIQECWSYA
ncbi:antiviral reverse transcriptase Drt3a [Burkholderia ubonensis]|uniref:antiviral reverse transcriptase Drt3a n=1 Tax=Burkholderia ubonensis TaxID=101571 RepID=UPI0009B3CCD2|nr:antiviral reverse transcriptase Drt3a [Burkholderia ubonensis]